MFDDPPPPEPAPILAEADAPPAAPLSPDTQGRVVIDLTQFAAKPPAEECFADEPDPMNPAILVCQTTGPSPRLGPVVGPVDEEFGSAIPRARIRLSDKASAEANAINKSVGGINANGGEVRLKIDF